MKVRLFKPVPSVPPVPPAPAALAAPAAPPTGARLIAGRPAAAAVLLAVLVAGAVSACTTSGSSVPTPQAGTGTSPGTHRASPTGHATTSRGASPGGTATTGRPGASGSATRTVTASATASATATATASATVTATATVTRSPTASVTTEFPSTPATSTAPAYPTSAPQTGGGGTAGLQNGLVLGIGGAAVLAGVGTLGYRRRLTRKFGPPGDGDGARRDPADHEPAGH